MFSFTKIILIATFVIVVVSSYQLDYLYYLGQEKPVTFGKNVKGAVQLFNSKSSALFDELQPEVALDFLYPDTFSLFQMPEITKIVVSVSEIEDDATFDVKILHGGVGQDYVYLVVLAKNSSILTARVKCYGIY